MVRNDDDGYTSSTVDRVIDNIKFESWRVRTKEASVYLIYAKVIFRRSQTEEKQRGRG